MTDLFKASGVPIAHPVKADFTRFVWKPCRDNELSEKAGRNCVSIRHRRPLHDCKNHQRKVQVAAFRDAFARCLPRARQA
jgi:hypothetical protein